MTQERELTREDLDKVEIVLGDALPYQVLMLEGVPPYTWGITPSLTSMASPATLRSKLFGPMHAV